MVTLLAIIGGALYWYYFVRDKKPSASQEKKTTEEEETDSGGGGLISFFQGASLFGGGGGGGGGGSQNLDLMGTGIEPAGGGGGVSGGAQFWLPPDRQQQQFIFPQTPARPPFVDQGDDSIYPTCPSGYNLSETNMCRSRDPNLASQLVTPTCPADYLLRANRMCYPVPKEPTPAPAFQAVNTAALQVTPTCPTGFLFRDGACMSILGSNCANGFTLVGYANVCSNVRTGANVCLGGYSVSSYNPNVCVIPTPVQSMTCPVGYTYSSAQQQCVYNIQPSEADPSCPSGFVFLNKSCFSVTSTACVGTNTRKPNSNVCIDSSSNTEVCLGGYERIGADCFRPQRTPACATGYTYSSSTGRCSYGESLTTEAAAAAAVAPRVNPTEIREDDFVVSQSFTGTFTIRPVPNRPDYTNYIEAPPGLTRSSGLLRVGPHIMNITRNTGGLATNTIYGYFIDRNNTKLATTPYPVTTQVPKIEYGQFASPTIGANPVMGLQGPGNEFAPYKTFVSTFTLAPVSGRSPSTHSLRGAFPAGTIMVGFYFLVSGYIFKPAGPLENTDTVYGAFVDLNDNIITSPFTQIIYLDRLQYGIIRPRTSQAPGFSTVMRVEGIRVEKLRRPATPTQLTGTVSGNRVTVQGSQYDILQRITAAQWTSGTRCTNTNHKAVQVADGSYVCIDSRLCSDAGYALDADGYCSGSATGTSCPVGYDTITGATVSATTDVYRGNRSTVVRDDATVQGNTTGFYIISEIPNTIGAACPDPTNQAKILMERENKIACVNKYDCPYRYTINASGSCQSIDNITSMFCRPEYVPPRTLIPNRGTPGIGKCVVNGRARLHPVFSSPPQQQQQTVRCRKSPVDQLTTSGPSIVTSTISTHRIEITNVPELRTTLDGMWDYVRMGSTNNLLKKVEVRREAASWFVYGYFVNLRDERITDVYTSDDAMSVPYAEFGTFRTATVSGITPMSVSINGFQFDSSGYSVGRGDIWDDLEIGDFTQTNSIDECRRRCDSEPTCEYWSRSVDGGRCYIYKPRKPESELVNYTRGLKVNRDGHLYAGRHNLYNTVQNKTHPANCITMCNQNDDCISWVHTKEPINTCKLHSNTVNSPQYTSALKYRAPPMTVNISVDTSKTTHNTVVINVRTANWNPQPNRNELKIQYKANTATTWTNVNATSDVTNNSLAVTIPGLSPAVRYDFRAIVTRGTTQIQSNDVSETTKTAPPPPAPASTGGSSGQRVSTGVPGGTMDLDTGRVYYMGQDVSVRTPGNAASDAFAASFWGNR